VGAIQPIRPNQLKLGLAKVDRSTCLAWDQGARCLVCVDACLVGAAQVYQGRIIVDEAKCTGCGRCECGCPVVGSAIHVQAKDEGRKKQLDFSS
jgi:ferredoxin